MRKLILAALLFATLPAFADTVNDFAFQPGSGKPIPIAGLLQPMDLYGAPASTNHISPFIPYMPFSYSLPENYRGSGQLILTLAGGGVFYAGMGTFSGTCGICSSVISFILPRGFYQPTNATLTIHFDRANADRSYNFQFMEPVPEPSSLVLLGIGLLGLTLKFRRAIIG